MNRSAASRSRLRHLFALVLTLACLLAPAAHAVTTFDGYVAPLAGYYRAGAAIDIGVRYSELVVVTGTPRLRLTTGGGPTLYANYAGGSESETLTFRYTVPAGVNVPFIVVSALELNGGSIVNLESEPAGAPATPQRFDATIDTAPPTVVSLRRFYPLERHTGSGTVIYRVAFSEWVVNAAPAAFTLRLSGTATGTIAWVRGDRADWHVAVSNISGQGSLALEVRPNIVSDYAGNPIAGFVTNEPYSCTNSTAPYAWGSGSFGQLGNNAELVSATPVPLYAATGSPLAGHTLGHCAAGYKHSVALARNGRLFAWGRGQVGQIGNGYNQSYNYPEFVKNDGSLADQQIIATAAGGDFNLALATNGLVFSWGDNSDGQLGRGNTMPVNEPVYVADTGTPMQGKTIVALAAGYRHALALDSSGQVYAWGDNSQGQLGNNSIGDAHVPVAVSTSGALAGKRVVAITAGFWFSAALTADGQVITWGMNHLGQLGIGNTAISLHPVVVTGGAQTGRTALEIAAGGDHLLVRNSDGAITAWGANYYGQVGNNATSASLLPVAVDSAPFAGASIARLSAGDSHSLALAADGRLFSWGDNSQGQLGLGTISTAPTASPSLVPAVSPATALAATGLGKGGVSNHSLAFFASRTFASILNGPTAATYGTGAQLDFYLNYAGSVTVAGTPHLVVGLDNRIARADLVANNGYGGLTFRYTVEPGDSAPAGLTIQAIVGAERITDSRGLGVNTALPSNTNISGILVDARLPQPLEITRAQPYAVTEAAAVTTASALIYRLEFDKTVTGVDAADFTLATTGTAAGTVSDVLGTGDSRYVVVTGVTGAGALRLDLKSTDTGITDTIGNPLAGGLATGPSYIHIGNTALEAWGYNNSGQAGPNNVGYNVSVPTLLAGSGALSGKTIAAIAPGGAHTLALCTDGTLATWGENSSGQLGCGSQPFQTGTPMAVTQADGLSERTVIAIAAGGSHSLALTSDGRVFGWGSNESGQLGRSNTSVTFPTPIHISQLGELADKQVIAIAAGAHHSLALTADGSLYAWGSDNAGQLGNGYYGSSTTPTLVDRSGVLAGKRLVAIAAGNTHNLVLDATGAIYAWGSNTYGEIGNDGYNNEQSPVALDLSVAAGGRSMAVEAVAAGAGYSLALGYDSSLFAWGDNSSRQLGNDSASSLFRTPVAVSLDNLGSDTVAAIAAGNTHSFARTDTGALYGWGDNSYSQLGTSFGYSVGQPSRINTGALAGAALAAISGGCANLHSLVLANTAGDPLSLVEQWRLRYFNTPFATGDATDAADPDADGRSNLLEYATATDPLNANSGPVAALAIAGTGNTRHLTLTFTRIADPNLTYTVEASTTLAAGSWSTIVPPATPLTGPVTVSDPQFMSGHTRRFLRLRIERTP